MIFVFLSILSASSNRTRQCTPKATLINITTDNFDQIMGSSQRRPVFARMQNEGCSYAPSSEGNWREAAELFPNIKFVKAYCIKYNDICHTLESSSSPSHSLYGTDKTKPLDTFGNPIDISTSSTFFSDTIFKNLGYYPFDSPTIEELIPQSTNEFYENYKYPIIILYDSLCDEDNDFLAQWLIDVNEEKISIEEVGFGRLDCSLYPDECVKWGGKYPSANVYSREKGISISITQEDKLDSRIKSVITALDKSDITYPTPQPYQPPITPVEPEVDNVNSITVPELQNRDIATIRDKYNAALTKSGNYPTKSDLKTFDCFDVELDSNAYSDVSKLLNFYRELAGLPNTVSNDATLNNGCYQAAKYLSRSASGGHSVNENYKTLCGSFGSNWDIIKTRLAQSNVVKGSSNVVDMITGLITDEGENNAKEVGHRRWFLYPYLETIGVGYYPTSYQPYDGYSMVYTGAGVYSVTHNKLTLDDYNGVKFVSWPPAGPFPFSILPTSWSVTYNKLKLAEVKKENIKVKITRDDGVELPISEITLNQRTNDPLNGCLVFQLTSKAKSFIRAGRDARVQVYILTDKFREMLDYTISFFDNVDQESICFYKNDKNKCPSSIPDNLKYGPGNYNSYSINKKRVLINVVEDITLSADLSLSFAPVVIFKGTGKVNGKVVVGVGNDVEFSNPTATDFTIQVDPTTFSAGKLSTQYVPKSITISYTKDFNSKKQTRALIYVGPYQYFNFQKKVQSGDYYYFNGISYNGQSATLVCKPLCLTEYFCQGGYFHYDNVFKEGDCIEFSEFQQLAGFTTKKKKIKIYAYGQLYVTPVGFKDKLIDYEIFSGSSLYVTYSPSYVNLAKTITIRPLKAGSVISPVFQFPAVHGTPYINKDSPFGKQYPFENLYLIDLNNNNDYKQKGFQIPNLLGDDNAKEILKASPEELVYDESSQPYFDENGVFEYKSTTVQYPLLITDGLHSEYTLKTINQYTRARIQPTQSSANKKVTFTILEREKNFKLLYFSNYEDLTIKTGSVNFPNIRLMNVNKITFIDLNGNAISGINSDISGGRKIDIVSDQPVNFNELYFRSSSAVDLKSNKCNNASVIESNPKIMNLQMNNLTAYSTNCILNNCAVNDLCELFITDKIPPTIYITNNTAFNPSSIKVIFYQIYSAKHLLESDSAYLMIFSEDTELINSLTSKFSFFDNVRNPRYDYKVVMSKDNKGIYLVSAEFNDANAPETTTPIDDPFLEDDISDQDYDVNKPAPTEGPPKPNDPSKPSGPNEQTGVIDPSYTPVDSEASNDENNNGSGDVKKKSGGLSKGAIAGIVIAVIVVVGAGVGVFLYIYFRRKKVYAASTDGEMPQENEINANNEDNDKNDAENP